MPSFHHVAIADGAPVTAGTGHPAGGCAVTVTIASTALLPLLARVALPPGERAVVHGEQAKLDLLHSWTDRVQGIPESD